MPPGRHAEAVQGADCQQPAAGNRRGSDGNLWFTEGTEFTGAPAKIGRITPSGSITEFDANCQFCILTDIVQGPADILYVTSNNPILLRFNLATGTFLAPIDIPNSNAVAGDLAAHGEDIWFTDFNNDSLWRYDITSGDHPVPRPRTGRRRRGQPGTGVVHRAAGRRHRPA